jgi:hypothetical protein
MTINTCRFVDASDLFEGLTDLWNEFFDSEPEFDLPPRMIPIPKLV